MSFSEFMGVAKDFIVSIASIIGATVALKGLDTWKRQMRGQLELDLSRRILVSMFKYRDAIRGVRNPIMWGGEMPTPPKDEADKMSRDDIRFYGTSKAYQIRWDKVQTERINLYSDLLEAEALWGANIKELFRVLFELENELRINIMSHLAMMNPSEDSGTKQVHQQILRSRRDVMYDNLDDKDEFNAEFKRGVEAIERYLKPKLAY